MLFGDNVDSIQYPILAPEDIVFSEMEREKCQCIFILPLTSTPEINEC